MEWSTGQTANVDCEGGVILCFFVSFSVCCVWFVLFCVAVRERGVHPCRLISKVPY